MVKRPRSRKQLYRAETLLALDEGRPIEEVARQHRVGVDRVEGWLEADRASKEPAEVERIAAACAVADRALAALLPRIRPGVTERALALELEWLMRTGGAEAVAFDPTCASFEGSEKP